MRILLDTCSFLWLVTEDTEHLSRTASDIFLNKSNKIYLSIASAWEISIKKGIGKLDLTEPVYEFLKEQIELNQLDIMPVKLDHAAKVSELPFYHKDPFDRLLIAQAIIEDMTILSADSVFKNYNVKTIW